MNENMPQDSNPETADLAAAEFQCVDEDSESLGAELSGELSEVEQLRAALAESKKQTLVAVADLENYRKRSSKNVQEQLKYAALPIMNDLLDTVDNLNRAIESADDQTGDSGLLEGVKMVSIQISDILKSNHCVPIPSVGQPFDPNLHQAVQMQPSEEFPADTVMMEMRAGYILHDRVVRPSQVFVSTGKPKSKQ